MQELSNGLLPFTPFLGAVVFVFTFALYYRLLSFGRQQPDLSSVAGVQNARGLLFFGASVLCLTLSLFCSLATSALILSRQSADFGWAPSAWFWGAFVVLNPVMWIVLSKFNVGGGVAGSFFVGLEQQQPEKGSSNGRIERIMTFMNMLGVTAVIMIIACLASLVSRRAQTDTHVLNECMGDFTLSLYSTAGVLGFAVLEIYSLALWAAPKPEGTKRLRDEISGLVNSYATAAGLLFSVLLILLYLPVALAHHHWLQALCLEAVRKKKDFVYEEWIARKEVATSSLSTFRSYIAIVFPLAVGLLTKVLGPEKSKESKDEE